MNNHIHHLCQPFCCPLWLHPPWILGWMLRERGGEMGNAGKHWQGLIWEIRSGGSDSHYHCSSDLTANVLHPAHLIQFTYIIFSLFGLACFPSPVTYCSTSSFVSFLFFSLHPWTRKIISDWRTERSAFLFFLIYCLIHSFIKGKINQYDLKK